VTAIRHTTRYSSHRFTSTRYDSWWGTLFSPYVYFDTARICDSTEVFFLFWRSMITAVLADSRDLLRLVNSMLVFRQVVCEQRRRKDDDDDDGNFVLTVQNTQKVCAVSVCIDLLCS